MNDNRKKSFRKDARLFLLSIIIFFLFLPQNGSANISKITLSKTETEILLNVTQSRMSEKISSDLFSFKPEEQAAISLIRKSIRKEIFRFEIAKLTENIGKSYVKVLLFLYAPPDIKSIFNKIESESKKIALRELENWLNQNEIKTANGELKLSYNDYQKNKRNTDFQYIMVFHSLKNGRAEIGIEFYSSNPLHAPTNKSSIGGNAGIFWDASSFLNQNKTIIDPFVVKVKTGVEKFGSGYKWDSSYKTEISVEFPDQVPDIRPSEKVSFFNKIKAIFKKIEGLANEFSYWIRIPGLPWQAEVIKNVGMEAWDKYQIIEPDIENNGDLSEEEKKQEKENAIENILSELQKENDFYPFDPKSQENELEKENNDKKDESEEESYWCKEYNDPASKNKVIFNEIAWMGTPNSSNDEWIELKNISNNSVSLEDWQLFDKKAQIEILFSKNDVIPANSFYLLERTDDNSVPFVNSDLIYVGSLNNKEESLYLFDENCFLQDKIEVESDWPAGENLSAEKRTMERDKDVKEWHTYSGYQNNGIWGTPRRENSPKTESTKDKNAEEGQKNEEEENDTEDNKETKTNDSYFLQKILITEVQIGGDNAKQDFIELYNPSEKEVDISGWQIKKKNQGGTESSITLFPEGSFISSKRYLLWASSKEENYPNSVNADIFRSSYLTKNNSIALFDYYDNLIDAVGWGNGNKNPFFESSPFSQNPKNYQSIERKKDQNEEYIDNNDNFNDFSIQNCPNPKDQTTKCYSPPSSGGGNSQVNTNDNDPGEKQEDSTELKQEFKKIIITEIQAHPIKERFVEIYNPNDEDIDLSSWYIQRKTENGGPYSLISSPNFEGKIIRAYDYFLISGESSSFSNKSDILLDLTITDSNTIILKNPNREVVDKVGWKNARDFEEKASIPFLSSQSIGRKWIESNNYQDTDNNYNDFEVQSPTPGDKNRTDNEPPQTEIISGPQKLTNQTQASFSFKPNEENCTFECKLEKKNWGLCQSPKKYEELEEGEHIFYIRAKDSFLNTEEIPIEYHWIIDFTIENPSISLFDLYTLSQFYTNNNTVGVDVSVSGPKEGLEWFLLEKNQRPSEESNWQKSLPIEFSFSSPPKDGLKSLYIWSKDDAGNISNDMGYDKIIFDATAPSSQINEINEFYSSIFTLSWSGNDNYETNLYSGISNYDLEYTTNPLDGVWIDWLMNTDERETEFSGKNNESYYFKIRAKDNARNIGNWSEIASTTIDANPPQISFESLDPIQTQTSFVLGWQAIDPIETVSSSGIDGFNLIYTVSPSNKDGIKLPNGKTWLSGKEKFLELEKNQYFLELEGKDKALYNFEIQAKDKAGNLSQKATTSTKIKTLKPILKIKPKNLKFEAIEFSLNPENQNILITNLGNSILEWEFVSPPSDSWVFLESFSGFLNPSDSSNIPISVDISDLESGEHYSEIEIISNDGSEKIFISLSLEEELLPKIEIVSPVDNSIFTFPENTISVEGNSNSGNYISIQEKEFLGTTADENGIWKIENVPLEEGENNFILQSRNHSGEEASTSLSVYLKIPILKIEENEFSFTSLEGYNPDAKKLILENVGEGNINWNIASTTESWISVIPNSDILYSSSSSELSINLNVSDLESGEYNTSFKILSENATNTPFEISINLKIEPVLTIKESTILSPDNFGSLIVSGVEISLNPGEYFFEELILEGGAKLLIDSNSSLEEFKGATINANNIDICDDCSISADEKGYSPMKGPGAGESNTHCNACYYGGAGYGGKGGDSGYIGSTKHPLIVARGGETYGSINQPTDLGSGGRNNDGGGAIKINVSETLKNDGLISANGKGPHSGSSGGSIWIITSTLNGIGEIYANGGSGSWDSLVEIFHASGGGGRIAVEYNNSDFLIENIFCNGGEIENLVNLPEEYDISDALGENGTIVINGIITQSPE